MSHCTISYILKEGNIDARFGGVGESPDRCPGCGRLFPLAKRKEGPWFVEMKCTRPDDHPKVGEHWHQSDGLTISWTVKDDDVWIA